MPGPGPVALGDPERPLLCQIPQGAACFGGKHRPEELGPGWGCWAGGSGPTGGGKGSAPRCGFRGSRQLAPSGGPRLCTCRSRRPPGAGAASHLPDPYVLSRPGPSSRRRKTRVCPTPKGASGEGPPALGWLLSWQLRGDLPAPTSRWRWAQVGQSGGEGGGEAPAAPHSLWATGPQGSGDRKSCAQPSGAPEAGKGGGSGRLGKGQGLGGRAAQQAGGPGQGREAPLPPGCVFFLCCSFDPSLVSLSPRSAVPSVPTAPTPPGDKLSLYLQSLRGLSIYYYGLIIMIIASVDPPPVRLTLLGFPGDPGCGGCTGSRLLAPPLPVLSGRQRSGATGWALKPWRGGGPTALPPPSLPFLQGVAPSWLWGAW